MTEQIKRGHKLIPGASATAFAELCLLLNSGYYNQQELQERIGVCNATMTRFMVLLKRRKLVYISCWIRTTRKTVAYWTWGVNVPDAPKPKPQTAAYACKQYRIRKKLANQKELYEERSGNLS